VREIGRLILLNIRRHRIRALISAAGIGFGVAAMLTIVSVILGAIGMFQNILSTESSLVVFERNVSDLFFSSVPLEQIRELRTLPGVESVAPMLVGIVQSPDHPIITCFGIEAGDPRLTSAQWLSGDRSSFDAEPQRVFLGARAAEFMKASVGAKVTIGKGEFAVGGVLRTRNGFEDGGVFMPLKLAQEYFHRADLASLATVKLKDTNGSAAFRAEVARRFPSLVALEDKEFNRSYSQFRILEVTAWAIGVCSFLLGGMGVANTMLMSVFSRVREIAILRVCGFSKTQIAMLVFGEAAVLASLGVLGGFAIGVGALEAMNAAPQLQGYVEAVIRPEILAAIAVVALFTAVGGALYPAWFASKIQPAEALRFE
jgi:putative ABC transport system permease protein